MICKGFIKSHGRISSMTITFQFSDTLSKLQDILEPQNSALYIYNCYKFKLDGSYIGVTLFQISEEILQLIKTGFEGIQKYTVICLADYNIQQALNFHGCFTPCSTTFQSLNEPGCIILGKKPSSVRGKPTTIPRLLPDFPTSPIFMPLECEKENIFSQGHTTCRFSTGF